MNMAVAMTFLTMVDLIGHAGTFWVYGVIAWCDIVDPPQYVSFLSAPRVRQRTDR
jgi:hypothetical protein